MVYQKAQENYLKNQIMSASPNRLIEMLLENAIKQTKLALLAIESNELAKVHKCLIKAQDIVTELQTSLNHEVGGEIADNLDRIYEFIYQQLVTANIHKKTQNIIEAQRLLAELLDTWEQVTA